MPSGDSVTVFSFVLTVPSLLSVELFVLEISRSHPTNRHDNAKTAVAAEIINFGFFIEINVPECRVLATGGTPSKALENYYQRAFLCLLDPNSVEAHPCFRRGIDGDVDRAVTLENLQ